VLRLPEGDLLVLERINIMCVGIFALTVPVSALGERGYHSLIQI
jgi:hypothetical protein